MYGSDRRLCFVGFRPTGDLGDLTAYTSTQGKVVWFPKSPPLKPASPRQLFQRQRFRNVGLAWRALNAATRADWMNAARRAHLYLNGYLLFLVWQMLPDRAAIRTIERQSGITLLH